MAAIMLIIAEAIVVLLIREPKEYEQETAAFQEQGVLATVREIISD